jgi:hypothetical protein
MMGASFRIIAVIVEVAILMVLVYTLFFALLLAVIDLGVDQKYKRYLGLVMTILGGLALIFFFGHLIAFYPRIPH